MTREPDVLLRVVRSGRWFRAECRLCFLECDAVSGMGPRHAMERLPCGRALMDWTSLHGGGNGRGCGEGHGGGAEGDAEGDEGRA